MHHKVLEILGQAKIIDISLYKKTNTIEISVSFDQLVPAQTIVEFQNKLCRLFGNCNVLLNPKFDLELSLEHVLAMYWNDLLYFINRQIALSKAFLHNCECQVGGDTLSIHLKSVSSGILKSKKLDTVVQDLIKSMFGISVKVNLISSDCNSLDLEEYIRLKSDEQFSVASKILKRSVYDQENKDKASIQLKVNKVDLNENYVLGKPFNDAIIKMSDISQDMQKIAVKGEIFRVEVKETRGNNFLFIFDITDFSSSVTVKFFTRDKTVDKARNFIKEGCHVKVRGELQYDRNSRELVVFARDIAPVQIHQQKMDVYPEKRVELHLHTQMSSMDGVTSASKYIQRAAEWGHKAIAITDHGVLQAFPEARDAARKHKIKVIYGVECYLLDEESNRTYHTIILVKNYTGLKNLYKIVSDSHIKHFYKRPRIPKELLAKNRTGLLVGSACEAGEIYSAILNNKGKQKVHSIAQFYDYFEIQPLGNNQFLINNNKVQSQQDLKDINKKIIELGELQQKLVVATCDVHFLDPKDEVFRRILMAGKGFSDADNQAPLFFRTTQEMLDEFEYLGESTAFNVVVVNTNKIADQIEEIIPIPDGVFPPVIVGAEDEIRLLAENKSNEIYGEKLNKIVIDTLNKELNSIIKNGFSVMYVIAQKLVKKSLSDGYLVGSRGSVGSSFVAFLVGITEVNPLPPHYVCNNCKYSEFITDGSVGCGFDLPSKNCPTCGNELKKDGYDIPFETFLGFDGDKEPDIDLNFSGVYQPVAHKYVEKLFGKKHVYRAGTIATIAEKTSYGFVKNYFESRNLVVTNAETNRLVKGCTGVKRTTGQHPGGIMIVPQNKSIFEFCPIQRPADATDSDIITTHFDYHSISGRLLKLDILGHDDPTVIKMLEDLSGVDAKTIPIGEKRTMDLFNSTTSLGVSPEDINCAVGTLGLPEFGTRFVRQMLVDTKPSSFAELIRISGLSHGTDVWVNNAQELIKKNTANLSEVICTRDDIMLNLMHIGLPPKIAFKIMEDVRKGKGLTPEYEQTMKDYKVPEWYISSCKKIKYMFPKAHAAAYVMMAFRIAWFKVYYPEYFYATYFTVRADDFDASEMVCSHDRIKNKIKELEQNFNNLTQKEKNSLTILEVINEMYARDIQFLPVDLYDSDSSNFVVTAGGIIPPLCALQGLGVNASQNIVKARKKAKFLSIDDIKVRANASKTVIEILERHGCLEGLPKSNQMSFL